ncbi:MAG TPA: dihydrodipicolinate reductase C-terminal domain-containing protein [Terriglobales bacterium]|jgi:4-hydroxy-tetrahydrodipicolinate reductase|nr:dihydrodipicolinate reductase C-terminal domain-containing protein [Terriglobales bacterium]
MKLLLLGRGKTGSLVAEVARERGHQVEALGSAENANASALRKDKLAGVEAVIDFTTPKAVLGNIEACVRAGGNMVVGTTGWYAELPRVRQMVEQAGTGFLYASNFSLGVNIFFDIARAAAVALPMGYTGSIQEIHHVHKKDAPSGTAVVLQKVLKEAGGVEAKIQSVREGEVVGRHTLSLDSAGDSIVLTHDAKSRRGFAEGAVRAAEWLAGRRGFYDFARVWRELR